MLKRAGIPILNTGPNLRLRDRGKLRMVVNYGSQRADAFAMIDDWGPPLIGKRVIEPAEICIACKKNTSA